MNRVFSMLCWFLSLCTMSFSATLLSEAEGPVLTGYITGFKDSTVVFLSNLEEQRTYDTAFIINNKFVLHGPALDEPRVLFLEVGDAWTSMIIGNDKVKVEGDVQDFPWDLRITGSKTEDENQKLKAQTKGLDKRRDELTEQYFRALGDEKNVIADSMSRIDYRLRIIKIAFIKEYPNTYVAVITLGELRNKLSIEQISGLFDLMNKEIRASRFGQVVQKFLTTRVAKVGEEFTDFEALDQKDNKVKLSSVKGRYKLLDFTASYCGPCRDSAEELREISKEYRDFLTLVSVSVDVSKDVWLRSLKRDKVSWLSLWDGKGSTGGAVLKYNASQLPTYVLIDANGKIIDKWRGYSTGSLKERLKRFNITD